MLWGCGLISDEGMFGIGLSDSEVGVPGPFSWRVILISRSTGCECLPLETQSAASCYSVARRVWFGEQGIFMALLFRRISPWDGPDGLVGVASFCFSFRRLRLTPTI